ncbi:Conserved_hypothetical protein [Hexamita inflata]|uniref:Uncharacterized protein n=1 Tax=Hexamita inflata TaxID=28002 RepID=A0AA86RCW3_9EUKA|nr:Conserved hypothetical protein [Hexamita inflata]
MTQRFISTNKSVGKLSFEEQLQTMVNFVKNTLNPPKHKFWDIVSQKLGVPVSQCVLKYNELIQKEEAPDLRPIPKKLSNNLLQYDTSLITQSTSQTITVRVTDGFQVESMQLPRLLLLEIPLLRDIMKTGNSFELNLNCNIQIFKMIITYLETGNLNIDDYNADELFRLSRYLQMVQLQALALDFTSSKNSQTQIELQQDHYDHIIRNNQSPFSISNTSLQKQLFQLALVRFQRLRFLTCKRCQITYPELLKAHFNDNCSHDFQADANPTTNFDRQMTLLRKRRCNYFELLLCFMSCCSVVLANDKQCILIDLVNGVNVQTNYDHITDKLQVMNIQQELVNVNLTPTLLYFVFGFVFFFCLWFLGCLLWLVVVCCFGVVVVGCFFFCVGVFVVVCLCGCLLVVVVWCGLVFCCLLGFFWFGLFWCLVCVCVLGLVCFFWLFGFGFFFVLVFWFFVVCLGGCCWWLGLFFVVVVCLLGFGCCFLFWWVCCVCVWCLGLGCFLVVLCCFFFWVCLCVVVCLFWVVVGFVVFVVFFWFFLFVGGYQILKDNFENVFLQKMIIQTQTQKNTKIEAFQMSYKPRSRIKQKPKEEFVVVNTQQKEEDGFQVINRDLFPMKETEATNKNEVNISQAVIAQIVHEIDLFV